MTSTPSMPAVSAVGTVALWGRVIEHERGWRAEFAYPDRLTLVCVVCLQEGSGAGEPAFVVAEPVASGPYPAVAVCRDHAASVTAEGSRVISPAAVIRSALLDRYAVDLMPFDTVRSLFERDPVPVPFTRPSSPTPVPARQVPARVAPAGSAATPAAPPAATPAPTPVRREPLRPTRPGPPSIGRRIARGIGQVVMFVLQAAFFLLMCAWGIGSCVMTVRPSDAATSPAPVVVPEPEVTDPSTLAVVRQPPDRDVSDFTAVCGRPHGAWVELKGCKNRGATLLGFAESPPQDHCCLGDDRVHAAAALLDLLDRLRRRRRGPPPGGCQPVRGRAMSRFVRAPFVGLAGRSTTRATR